MIKKYFFDYNIGDATAEFEVDTEKFTPELAHDTLDFFSWSQDYDHEADPVDEVMKKYALEAIRIATFNGYNVSGVIDEFNDNEGYYKVDGSVGIKLIDVNGYEFDSDFLKVTIN